MICVSDSDVAFYFFLSILVSNYNRTFNVSAGIGKSAVLQQAARQLLQSRAWLTSVYLPAPADPSRLTNTLADALKVALPASAPAEYTTARLGYCLALGHSAGVVIDHVQQAGHLSGIAAWAAALRTHAPNLQVIMAARLDTGATLPVEARHFHLSPLQEDDTDLVLEQAVLAHAHRRFAMPLANGTAPTAPPPPNSVRSGRSVHSHAIAPGTPRTPRSSMRHNSYIAKGTPPLARRSSSSHAVKQVASGGAGGGYRGEILPAGAASDLSSVVQPALSLAREGVELCRGVPLLLHVLAQVALACVLTPQSHDATVAFSSNLQVRMAPVIASRSAAIWCA